MPTREEGTLKSLLFAALSYGAAKGEYVSWNGLIGLGGYVGFRGVEPSYETLLKISRLCGQFLYIADFQSHAQHNFRIKLEGHHIQRECSFVKTLNYPLVY